MLSFIRISVLWCCAVILLTACGGGGGSGGSLAQPTMPPGNVAPIPDHTPPMPDPRVPVELNNEDFGYSTEYIQSAMQSYAAQSGNWAPMVQPPVIRPAVGTSNEVLGALVLAVNAMNAWLPYDQHIRIGEPIAQFTRDPRQVATGDILLGESSLPLPDLSPDTLGYAQGDPTANGNYLRAGTIVLTHVLQSYPLETMINVLMHEMLHTMGMFGHLDPNTFPDSIMHARVGENSYLPTVDGLTLLMGYTQLRPGANAPEINAADLGPWAEDTPALAGSLEACACVFGADLIGGHAVSWFSLEPPEMFVQNLGPTGTASWVGKMVGWTTDQEAVWSDMNLDVSLDSFDGTSLDGQVAFDNISLYESGTQWGDGALAYNIDVANIYFLSRPDNPEGYVFGFFGGPSLEGAVGTLEHPELTGAFGGSR